MTTELSADLEAVAEQLVASAEASEPPAFSEPLQQLTDAAIEVGRAWSGSSIGYHARVYYAGFARRPAAAHFSSEWGFSEAFSSPTRGDWQVHTHQDVVDETRRRAGNPDLDGARSASAAARRALEDGQAEVDSILTALLGQRGDDRLEDLRQRARDVVAGTEQQYQQAMLPSGQIMSRDMEAMTEGLFVAPHQAVQAEVLGLQAPFEACRQLAAIAGQAAAHLKRLAPARRALAAVQGERVFIGHGRSHLWRELKDFVQDRLGLEWDEFNRVPVAGVTNITRLSEMLDAAGIAFLVLTAEDEQSDGSANARQNVVHEAGLFQGRLGFTRAIVLLEEGCAEFSNIQGLGQIRFPEGRIDAAFEEVRRVVEREELLSSSSNAP